MSMLPVVATVERFGIPDIDRGVERLLEWIRRCLEAGDGEGDERTALDTVAATIACAGRHFSDEERLMSQARFPHLGRHILDHQEALGTLYAFGAMADGRDLAVRVGSFLAAWINGHGATLDREFTGWLERCAGGDAR